MTIREALRRIFAQVVRDEVREPLPEVHVFVPAAELCKTSVEMRRQDEFAESMRKAMVGK